MVDGRYKPRSCKGKSRRVWELQSSPSEHSVRQEDEAVVLGHKPRLRPMENQEVIVNGEHGIPIA